MCEQMATAVVSKAAKYGFPQQDIVTLSQLHCTRSNKDLVIICVFWVDKKLDRALHDLVWATAGSPPRQREFPPVRPVPYNWRAIVWKDAGQRRQIARAIVHRPRQFADRLLSLRDGVEVAHGRQSAWYRPT